MLLRRIIEHAKSQNWTAIVLDFLIVVLGVFIGIQMSNWNDARVLDGRRAAAAERLHQEAEHIVTYFHDEIAALTRFNDARAEAITRLINGDWEGADPHLLDLAFGTTALAGAAEPPRTAYDELVSTGLFAEIGDTQTRDAISSYYASLSRLQGQIQYARSIITANRARVRPGIKLILDRQAFRERRRVYDLELLQKDDEFIQEFIDGHSRQVAIVEFWREALEAAERMCEQISEISNRPFQSVNADSGE